MFRWPNPEIVNRPLDYSTVQPVVDASTFRPDSEAVRSLKFQPQSSDLTKPVYDYPDGNIPDDDSISPEIIALRSGKLDKADIPQVKQNIIEKAKASGEADKADKMLKAVEKTLGISESEKSESE